MTVPPAVAETPLAHGNEEAPSELVEQSASAPNAESTLATSFQVPGQVVLILCGLIASGKVCLFSHYRPTTFLEKHNACCLGAFLSMAGFRNVNEMLILNSVYIRT
jgi:hypothetical protein